MQGYTLDKQTLLVDECFAVIYAPRRKRDRFPENCVTVVDNAEMAFARARPDEHIYPAKVVGPARSSEGFRVFYIVAWLDNI